MLSVVIFLIAAIKCQQCSGSDLLVDDFSIARPNKASALGASWSGDAQTVYNVDASKKSIIVQSTKSTSNWFTTDFVYLIYST